MSPGQSATRPTPVPLDLLRPLAVAAANAVRRSRIELTVYAPDGGIEGTVWFGVPEEEQAIVTQVIAAWPGVDLLIQRDRSDGGGGTRPPAPSVERAADPGFQGPLREALLAIGRETALVVPLVDRGTLLGRLSVWSPGDARPLAQSAILAAVALGEQAGLTIRDARRLAAAERRIAVQDTLLRIGRSIDPTAPLPESLSTLARAGLGVGSAAGCAIELLPHDGDESVVVADESIGAWTHETAVGARHRPAASPTLSAALRSGRPWLCAVDDLALGPALTTRYQARRARHLLIAPISLDARTFGVALLAWRGRHAPPASATALGRDFADQLTFALDRLRLATALRVRTDLDGATGLPGRHALEADLDREIARAARSGRRFAVALVHPTDSATNGDDARTTTDLLRATVRSGDRLGRYHNAFLLILPDTDARQAAHVAVRLRNRAMASDPGNGPSQLPLGIGIAAYPDDGVTAGSLIAQALKRSDANGAHPRLDRPAAPTATDDPVAVLLHELQAALIGTL